MKPRLLDLFCGAGGASKGYADAGWEVVGVDLHPQPRYPYEFHRADAMTFPLAGFDAIHASPPCQSYSNNMRHLATPQPKLIEPMRERLQESGLLYVIENVEGAPMIDPLVLCGTMFDLRIWRHRLFESNVALHLPPKRCDHAEPPINPHRATSRRRHGWTERQWREEMGVSWMSGHEGRESIPPVYTAYIGRQLLP